MKRALIGFSGFVGGNLANQVPFDDLYNSSNIDQITGKSYDLLVCAGARAEKWKANRDPAGDLRQIESLMSRLVTAEAKLVILISTVDVYARPIDVDEEDPADEEHPEPYGRDRARLERLVRERFPHLIVRLPGLFGPGLKKNIIYDFLHQNQLDKIHSDSMFQFYPLRHLASDLEIAQRHSLATLNLSTEPTSVREVARSAFHMEFENTPAVQPARYDMRSLYAELFGGSQGYAYGKDRVLAELEEFVQTQKAAHA